MATADTPAFTIQVNSPTSFPLWDTVIPQQNLVVGTAFSLDLDSVCTDGPGLFSTYSVVSGVLPPGLTLSGTRNRILSGTPTAAGTSAPVFRANDGIVNSAPTWNSTPGPSFTQGVAAFHPATGTYQSNSFVTDVDLDPITITKNAAALPPGVTFTSGASARFTYDGVGAVGSTSGHILTANDGQGHTVAGVSFSVGVVAPAFPAWDAVIPLQGLTVGVPYSLDLDTVCTDGPGLLSTYSVVAGSLPAGLTLSGTRNRILSGTPTTAGSSSPTIRASDGVVNSAPVWNSTPNPTFTQGVASFHPPSGTYQSTNVVADIDGDPITITKNAIALPSGITFTSGGAARFTYSGSGSVASTSGHILTANDGQGHAIAGGPFAVSINVAGTAEADWIARSQASGVTFASDFRGPNDFLSSQFDGGHVFAGGLGPEMANVVKDTTDGLTGGCCLRIDVPPQTAGGSAAWICSMNSAWTTKTQGMGNNPFWIQFRFKIPASRLVLSNVSSQYAWKWLNIAHYSPTNPSGESASNRLDEHVLQDTDQRGFPQAYHRTTAGIFPPFEENFGAFDFKKQNMVDNGAQFSDPQDRYCIWTNSGATYAGCHRFFIDEWMTFKVRIRVGTYGGTAGNEFDMWYARQNATAWDHTHSFRNYDVGPPGEFTGGLNGLWFLTFESTRINSSVSTYHKYDQVIVSLNDIPLPAPGA